MAGRIVLGDPDELPRMAAALSRHVQAVHRARDLVGPIAGGLRERVDRDVMGFEARVARAEAAVRQADDHHSRAAAERQRQDAVARWQEAVRLRGVLRDALAGLEGAVRAQVRLVDDVAEPGIGLLGRFWQDVTGADASFRAQLRRFLEPGRARGGLGGPGRAAAAGLVPPRVPPAAARRAAVGPDGHVLVDLGDVDASDSTVSGPESFRHVPMAQMREGLLLLEKVVLPEVRAGAGRDRMRELDGRTGLAGSPVSHLRIYEAFFGDTAVRLSVGPTGALVVTNGYHRIWLAGRLGIDQLPARVDP
jgi:hypothetical protein